MGGPLSKEQAKQMDRFLLCVLGLAVTGALALFATVWCVGSFVYHKIAG